MDVTSGGGGRGGREEGRQGGIGDVGGSGEWHSSGDGLVRRRLGSAAESRCGLRYRERQPRFMGRVVCWCPSDHKKNAACGLGEPFRRHGEPAKGRILRVPLIQQMREPSGLAA